MKDLYRETGTLFKRSPLVSPEGESFASRVRAVVADHARQLRGTLERVKREGGRYTQGMAGYKQTRLPGGVVVKTWINPFGLVPTLMARVYYPESVVGEEEEVVPLLESGLLQIVNEGGGVLSTLLHLGDKIPLQYTPSFDWNGDAVVNAQDRVFPVGMVRNLLPIETPVVGDIDPAVYSSAPSRLVESDEAKAATLLLPASVFTGKLRLYVQTIYGAKRSDVIVYLESSWPRLRVGAFDVSYRSVNSHFLVTTSNWEYWIAGVSLNRTSGEFALTINKLIPRQTNISFYDWALSELRDKFPTGQDARKDEYNAANKAALENIVLSFLEIESDVYQVITLSCTPSDFPLGGTMGYGWHANWDGSKAKIVLVTTDTAGFAIGGRELGINLSHAVDGGTGDVSFSASLDIGNGVVTKVLNDFCVWEPDGTFQTSSTSWLNQVYMCGIVDPDNAIISYPAPEECDNLPLYGWFDGDNTWQTCTFSRNSLGPSYADVALADVFICHGSSDYQITDADTYDTIEHKLSIGGQELTTKTCSNGGARVLTYEISSGGTYTIRSDFTNNNNGAYPECGSGTFPGFTDPYSTVGWFTYTAPIVKGTIQDTSNIQWVGRVSLVIPHNDCDAVIGVQYQDILSTRIQIDPGSPTELGRSYGSIYTNVMNDVDGVQGTVTLWSGTDVRGTTTAVIGGSGFGTSTYYDNIQKTQLTAILGDYAGLHTIAEYTDTVNNIADPGYNFSWNGGANNLPSIFGENSGSGDRDWEVFMFAPSGVCSSGNRTVGKAPAIMLSAIHFSKLGQGDPDDMEDLTNDGFTEGHTFVGFA